MNNRIRKKWLKRSGKYINPRDTWNLDVTISEFIIPRLELFRKVTCGRPQEFSTMEEWYSIIDKMIAAFRMLSDEKLWNSKDEENVIEDGLGLFCKYLRHLWW